MMMVGLILADESESLIKDESWMKTRRPERCRRGQ